MTEPTIAETAGWKPTGADPAAPLKEFYAPPAGPTLGRPEDDLPFTIRIQPPWTWERRHDPDTPRVVKIADEHEPCWAIVDLEGRLADVVDLWLTADDVRNWPIQHPVAVEAVMAKLRRAEKPQERPAPELVGDMDVEAFKGGATILDPSGYLLPDDYLTCAQHRAAPKFIVAGPLNQGLVDEWRSVTYTCGCSRPAKSGASK